MSLDDIPAQRKMHQIPEGHQMRPMLDAMRAIQSAELKTVLDRTQREKESDSSAGIFIAKLNRSQMEIGGQSYSFYGARVLNRESSGGQPFVTPHFHKSGAEPYYFQAGTGEMNLGKVIEVPRGQKRRVEWSPPVLVKQGDEFLIEAGQVHSFRNTAEKPVDFIFACPDSHLRDNSPSDPSGDRYIARAFPGGIPSHFNSKS